MAFCAFREPARLETAALPSASSSSSLLLTLTRGLSAVIPPSSSPTGGGASVSAATAVRSTGVGPSAAAASQLTLPDGRLGVGTHLPLMARRYRYLAYLGEGVSAQVILAEDSLAAAPSRLVAIKVLRRQHVLSGQREARALRYLHGAAPAGVAPGVVQLLDSFMFGAHFCLVTERLYPWLLDWVAQSAQLPAQVALTQLRKIAHQLLAAVAFMHNHGLVNADIKPDNLLFCGPPGSSSVALRLVDFGGCFSLTETDTGVVGCEVQTLPYRAPEAALGLSYGSAIDLWSVGVVLAEMALKRALLPCDTPRDLLHQMVALLGPVPEQMVRSSPLGQQMGLPRAGGPAAASAAAAVPAPAALPAELSQRVAAAAAAPQLQLPVPTWGCPLHAELAAVDASLADLVMGLLAYDPAKRLTAQQALLHPWFAASCPLRAIFPQLNELRRMQRAAPHDNFVAVVTTGGAPPAEATPRAEATRGTAKPATPVACATAGARTQATAAGAATEWPPHHDTAWPVAPVAATAGALSPAEQALCYQDAVAVAAAAEAEAAEAAAAARAVPPPAQRPQWQQKDQLRTDVPLEQQPNSTPGGEQQQGREELARWQALSAGLAPQEQQQQQSRLPAAHMAARQWEEQRQLAAADPYGGSFSLEVTPQREQRGQQHAAAPDIVAHSPAVQSKQLAAAFGNLPQPLVAGSVAPGHAVERVQRQQQQRQGQQEEQQQKVKSQQEAQQQQQQPKPPVMASVAGQLAAERSLLLSQQQPQQQQPQQPEQPSVPDTVGAAAGAAVPATAARRRRKPSAGRCGGGGTEVRSSRRQQKVASKSEQCEQEHQAESSARALDLLLQALEADEEAGKAAEDERQRRGAALQPPRSGAGQTEGKTPRRNHHAAGGGGAAAGSGRSVKQAAAAGKVGLAAAQKPQRQPAKSVAASSGAFALPAGGTPVKASAQRAAQAAGGLSVALKKSAAARKPAGDSNLEKVKQESAVATKPSGLEGAAAGGGKTPAAVKRKRAVEGDASRAGELGAEPAPAADMAASVPPGTAQKRLKAASVPPSKLKAPAESIGDAGVGGQAAAAPATVGTRPRRAKPPGEKPWWKVQD